MSVSFGDRFSINYMIVSRMKQPKFGKKFLFDIYAWKKITSICIFNQILNKKSAFFPKQRHILKARQICYPPVYLYLSLRQKY